LKPHPAAILVADPISPIDLANLEIGIVAAAGGFLILAGLFGSLRHAMAQSVASRVLKCTESPEESKRIARLLERLGPLSTSAAMLESGCALLFCVLVVRLIAWGEVLDTRALGAALAISVPSLWLVNQAVARAVALRWGDALLVHGLPGFRILQLPIAALVWPFEAVRRGVMRLFGLPDDTEAAREIVADLKEVIADTEVSGKLHATEREIIENVMEVRDVDVAAIMTPRTEIRAIEVGRSVIEAARMAAESGYSRLPVYEGNQDNIIGTISARALMGVLANGESESATQRDVLKPAFFVPETKHISELLTEFRRTKTKLAIVLDEYGGTAGMVTLADVLGEIVGDLSDDDDSETSPIRQLPGGVAEVSASMHVSEVNEALDLDIPEEADYETLGGFVLSELGHFPKRGETFPHGGAEYTVVDANDRRVLKVRVRPQSVPA
jgi:CBS domain containing-hemolysin-like protein